MFMKSIENACEVTRKFQFIAALLIFVLDLHLSCCKIISKSYESMETNDLKFVAIVSEIEFVYLFLDFKHSPKLYFSSLASSTRRPFTGSSIRQWPVQKLRVARRCRCPVTKRRPSTVRHGKAFKIEIRQLVADRRLLHAREHASSKQFRWAVSHECWKYVGRTHATNSVQKLPTKSMATSSSECDTNQSRLREHTKEF